ncbi:MAG: hypothetical protein V1898_02375 [Patescibacteria group bacterium]
MWFITTLIAAIIVTLLFYFLKNKYKLGFLCLMLWGATIMILVDHVLGYEGGEFFETQTDGLITSGTWLGIAMLVPVILIWLIANLISLIKLNKS